MMSSIADYMRAVDILIAADPDTRHGAIAVLLAEALKIDPDAAMHIGEALLMLQQMSEARACVH